MGRRDEAANFLKEIQMMSVRTACLVVIAFAMITPGEATAQTSTAAGTGGKQQVAQVAAVLERVIARMHLRATVDAIGLEPAGL